MAIIYKPSEIDVSKITFNPNVKTLDSGCKMVWAQYDGQPLIMQLPTMKAPFGISYFEDNKKYSLDLSFDGKDSNESLKNTYEMLQELDKKLMTYGMENSMTLFKKRYQTLDIMEALYTPIIRQPKDEKYSPTIKFNLNQTPTGEFKFSVFDGTKNKVNLLDINSKGSRVTAIVQWTGIWLAGGKFGASWKIQQLRVVPRATLQEYAFLDDENDRKNLDVDDVDDIVDDMPFREDSE
jgi:hypothetical protein